MNINRIGKLTKAQEAILRELRRAVTLENANFNGHSSEPLPRSYAEVDGFVKERTRLHRESWILPLIDGLLGDCPEGVDVCRHLVQIARRR